MPLIMSVRRDNHRSLRQIAWPAVWSRVPREAMAGQPKVERGLRPARATGPKRFPAAAWQRRPYHCWFIGRRAARRRPLFLWSGCARAPESQHAGLRPARRNAFPRRVVRLSLILSCPGGVAEKVKPRGTREDRRRSAMRRSCLRSLRQAREGARVRV